MIFDLFGVESYTNTESPDYIIADGGGSYASLHGQHVKRKTIFQNAENIERELPSSSIDLIFSVACFEHIYDLESALISCHRVQKKGGFFTLFLRQSIRA
jgi:SAM-dependent methyltransferase